MSVREGGGATRYLRVEPYGKGRIHVLLRNGNAVSLKFEQKMIAIEEGYFLRHPARLRFERDPVALAGRGDRSKSELL